MKKNIFGICLCAIALSGLLLVSCSKEETVEVIASVPTLSVTSSVTVSATGGDYSFNCTVSNAADDGEITASADVSWISDVTVGTGTIAFTVAANTSAELRTANITVEYRYTDDGASRTVTEKVGIVQSGAGTPSLTVQPNAVAASYGGGSYSFTYDVTNATDGEINCTSDQTWVSGFDYSTYGTVSFTVAANEGEELRTATITVTYTYTGGTLTKEVTVIQDHPGSGSGSGGGGGDADVSDIIGTYTATGYSYYDSGVAAENTWTMKIYASNVSGYDVFIDGLAPDCAGSYDGSWEGSATEAYIAQAYINSAGQIVIPAQLTGYVNSGGYYIGWYPCLKFEEGAGWYRGANITDCTFTYDASTDSWTSDYGEFMALFSGQSPTSDNFYGFYDVTNPGVVITKTSSSTSVTSTNNNVARHSDGNLIIHTDSVLVE